MSAPYIELPAYQDGTREWLEQRRSAIGSSDASTVTGMNRYKSLYELWIEKTRMGFEPHHSERTLELFEAGHRIEPVTREWTADRLGITINKPERAFESVEYPFLHANVDGLTNEATPRIFEAKNTSEWNRGQWDNQIPDHAEIQVNHAGLVTGFQNAIVSGIIGGNTLKIYEVELSPNVQEIILERAQHFWEYNVKRVIPPEIDDSELAYNQLLLAWKDVKSPREIGGTEAEDLIKEYAHLSAQMKQMEKRKNMLRNQIMQEAEGHTSLEINGMKVASFRGGQVNTRLLFQDHPEFEEEYAKTVTKFDSTAFKNDHEDLYRKYQGKSLNVVDEETFQSVLSHREEEKQN